ncbi:MAG: glycoside hydrolase family 97 protein [Bacteroidales bacterium]
MLRTTILLSFFLLAGIHTAKSENFEVASPDGKIRVEITAEEQIRYSVFFNETEIIRSSVISMELEEETLGENPRVRKSAVREIKEKITPVVKEKRALVRNHCNELRIDFRGKYSLLFRAYNDGIAWRWITDRKGEMLIIDETAGFHLAENDSVWFPEEESFLTHSERKYLFLAVKDITSERMSCMPALICRPDGIRIAVTEAALFDYPGMYITGTDGHEPEFTSTFPPYPLKEKQTRDRTVVVEEAAEYIAKTIGPREFPWRVLIIADRDGALIESDMVYRLGRPSELIDFFWIEPGKVAWDWWNALNVYGVDFESGVNTETYKYFIDFAADYGFPYIILDEGWSDTEDLFDINPDIDLEELLRYAESKDVGIILWVVWLTLDRQLEAALDQFEAWGVKGIKVDFMQRDDQLMVNYYGKIAREAARRRLLVNFHGSYKPTGLRRTWPNVLTREGVLGAEHNKWSENVTPDHNLTLPFTRMLAGPMDYTPGAMINCTEEQFKSVWNRPMSMGTRCHQLAMYVVYESPLQMLADSPSNYDAEDVSMEFLSRVPVTWDETMVPEAAVGDYVVVVRKKDDKWYVGAMTGWMPRKFKLHLDFLEGGIKKMTIWKDGMNADKNPVDVKKESRMVTRGDTVEISLAPGGGWVAIIE